VLVIEDKWLSQGMPSYVISIATSDSDLLIWPI